MSGDNQGTVGLVASQIGSNRGLWSSTRRQGRNLYENVGQSGEIVALSEMVLMIAHRWPCQILELPWEAVQMLPFETSNVVLMNSVSQNPSYDQIS